MVLPSLIGFGLVFLVSSMVFSVALSGGLQLAKRRLRSMGPRVERRAATLALLLPALLGGAVVAILVASSALAIFWGTDHCLDHSHHIHLCLKHGALWATKPWAVASIACFSTFVFVRFGQTLAAHLRAWKSVKRLKATAQSMGGAPGSFLVDNAEKFAFTVGMFHPAVFVSTAAWSSLDESGRRALLAHEQVHVVHGDVWKRALLGLMSCFGAPVLASKALNVWENASERMCDRHAALLVGKPSIVADAILSLTRSTAGDLAPSVAVFAADCNVTDRIHALFDNEPIGSLSAKRILLHASLGSLIVVAGFVFFADALHHLLETILG